MLIHPIQIPDEGEKWKVKVPRELTRVSIFRKLLRVAVALI